MRKREALGSLAAAAAVAVMLAGCGTVASGTAASGTSLAGGTKPAGSAAANADVLLCREAAEVASASVVQQRGIASPGFYPGYPVVPVHGVTAKPAVGTQSIPNVGPVVAVTPATARWLARALCALPLLPRGARNCPFVINDEYTLSFTVRGRQLPAVTVQTTACRQVVGVGSTRSALRDGALLQKLAVLTAGIDNGGPMHKLSAGG